MKIEEEVEWVTAADVAAAFNVDSVIVYRHCKQGIIPCYRFGKVVRIPKSWLDGELARFRAGQSVQQMTKAKLIEEGRRIERALEAARQADSAALPGNVVLGDK